MVLDLPLLLPIRLRNIFESDQLHHNYQNPGREKLRRFRILAVIVFIAGVVALLSQQSMAFPPFLAKAKKFGAKDCRFCHIKMEGGEPYAVRGKWLISEKAKRNADAVDPEWLADYKAAKKGKK
jgi:hypothetical protein